MKHPRRLARADLAIAAVATLLVLSAAVAADIDRHGPAAAPAFRVDTLHADTCVSMVQDRTGAELDR